MAVYLTPDKIETWNGVTVKQYFLTKHNTNKIALPTDKLIDTSAITIHNTEWIKVNSATTPAEQYTRATINGNMNNVVVHFYVDHSCAWWTMPLDMVTWHSGDGVNGRTGNNTSISIECIMDATNATYSQKAMDNTARLAAYLLDKYNLKVDTGLVTHTYWLNKKAKKTGTKYNLCTIPPSSSAKTCPYYIIKGKGWNYFEGLTKKYLDALNPPTEMYRIRKTWADSKTQIGAFTNLESAKDMARYNEGYKVFNSKGQVVYTPAQYYTKYSLSKTDKAYKDEIFGVITKGTKVDVLVGTERKENDGTIWIKALYNSKTVWLPLDSLQEK